MAQPESGALRREENPLAEPQKRPRSPESEEGGDDGEAKRFKFDRESQ